MDPKSKHDPRELLDCLFRRSKSWWIIVNLSRTGLVLLGITSAILFPNFRLTPVLIFLLYVLLELSSWRSESFKRSAETVLRKLDFRDSLGWQISNEEMSDLVVDCPARLRKRLPLSATDDYFASTESPGLIKALENLQESAWWTKHLAKRMAHITLFITISVSVCSVMLLLIGVNTLESSESLTSVGRVVTASLMLVLSLGLVRLTLGYYLLGKKAEQAEKEAGRQLKTTPDQLEVVKSWHDYQVARAGAPLLPTTLWRIRRNDLNEAWELYRNPRE